MKIGQPQSMLLREFGELISKAFGTDDVYHVGSSLQAIETWRDVDVRVLLTESEWENLGLLEPKNNHYDAKWRTLCIVFSHYGKHMTGLPIDFQIQRVTEANTEFKGNRSHLGIYNVQYSSLSKEEGKDELTDYGKAVQMAKRFHELYEEYAPLYGYETRKETRDFNEDSPNGKLMIAVCEQLQLSSAPESGGRKQKIKNIKV